MSDSPLPPPSSHNPPISPEPLELVFEEAVHHAANQPAIADIRHLWQLAEQLLERMAHQSDYRGQLAYSGQAIAQIVEIFVQRAEIMLRYVEQTELSADEADEPILLDDLLQGLIRQTMALNLEEITYPTPIFERQSGAMAEDESVAEDVEKDALLQWLEQHTQTSDRNHPLQVAHEENISGWAAQVRPYMTTNPQQPVQLRELAAHLQWGIVQLWMTLLLGNLNCQWEMEGDENSKDAEVFYRWDWQITIATAD